MEKWIAPEVVIDKFFPDQYVAICTVDVSSVNSNYIDLAKGRLAGLEIESWEIGDGKYQVQEEVLDKQGDYTLLFRGPFYYPNLRGGWHTNITLYGDFRDNLNYINGSDAYDVWVYRNGIDFYADIYKIGAADAAASGKNPANHS